jgi:type VI secretion system protein ImpH
VGVSAHQLGMDFCLGRYVWDRQHKFRIRLGPLKLDNYMGMLPGSQPFNELVAWVAEYLGHELDWDLNLILEQPEVPALQLNGRFRLGFNTWLGRPETDAKDLILARHYAEQANTSQTSRSHEHGCTQSRRVVRQSPQRGLQSHRSRHRVLQAAR